MKKKYEIYWLPTNVDELSVFIGKKIEILLNAGYIIERTESTNNAVMFVLSIELKP